MGDSVTINGNIVENCGDVGIDFEGTTNGIAVGNSVKDCQNGCLSTFFYCKNIVFEGNAVRQTGTNGTVVYFSNNNTQSMMSGTSISLIGNTFQCDTLGSTVHSATEFTIIESNKFYNCKLNMQTNNAGEVAITNNYLYFTNEITGDSALRAGQTSYRNLTIKDNIIKALVASNSDNVYGIYVLQEYFSSITKSYIVWELS